MTKKRTSEQNPNGIVAVLHVLLRSVMPSKALLSKKCVRRARTNYFSDSLLLRTANIWRKYGETFWRKYGEI